MTRLWRIGLFTALLAGLLAASAVAQASTLLSTGAVWKYFDTGADLGVGWRAPGFDDLDWLSGPAELGFGDGDEATTNQAGAVTYYYRTTFNVPSAAAVTNLRARLLRDDGAVVYLNGVEAFRDNMPTGEVVAATLASGNATEPTPFYSFPVDPALLTDGVNVVAVEVHQSATNSSDVSFNFDLTGNPMPTISISTPTNGQTVVASTVVVGGTATPGGPTLTLVEVFAGATKIGESTNESFGVVWQDVVPGNYTLVARMVDSSGLRATSAPVNITVQAVPASVLIPAGSVWRYLDTGVDQGTTWTALAFNDAAWKTGAAQLGYGDSDEATVISYGPNSSAKYPTYYFRKVFTVNDPSAYTALTMTLTYDDGAVVYINGMEVYRINMASGTVTYATYAVNATDYTPDVSSLATSVLVPGTNVVAVEIHQCNATSSDASFDLQLEGDIDNVAPTAIYDPDPGSTLLDLTMINVVFSESVIGVDGSDLLINGEAATSVVTNNPNDFTFHFTQPTTGRVQVAWAMLHGITDRGSLANPFAGGSWSYTLDTNVSTTASFIISEFLADNNTGIRDEDGNRSDWIEIKNTGVLQALLDGYYLTDTPTNLTKWRFPSGLAAVQANNYLVVWASAKNRTNPVAALHTNFKLAKEAGNFLALVSPQGQIVSAFTNYPAQQSDISYGRDAVDPNLVGYFATPTPRKVNSTAGSGFVPEPIFSFDTGIYTNATLTVTMSLSNAPAGSTIRYAWNGVVPTSSSPLYTGPLTIGTNAVIKVRVFPPAGTNLLPSRVVAKSYVFLDGASKDFNSNLPLMIIDTHGQQIVSSVVSGGARTEGSFVVIDTTRGRSSLQDPVEFHGTAGFEGYGQTSIGFAKPPIRIEIHDELGNDLDVPVLGLPADSDWKLRNPYDDKTLLNDFLAYELFEQMGQYSLRRRFVEVFVTAPSVVNGGWSNTNRTGRLKYPSDYAGVLVLFETVKAGKDRVDISKLTPYDNTEPNVTGGYIFKKDKDSNGDINFSTVGSTNTSLGYGGQTLKVHEPNVQELRTAPSSAITTWPGAGYTVSASNQLRYLVSYLNQMERALYRSDWTNASLIGTTNHYSYYMDVDAFVDQHWIVEFTKQIDGYRLSDYFAKDRNGKVAPYPIWDWNLAFGNAYYLRGGHTNGWYFQEQDEGITYNEHPWLRRLINGAASMGAVLPDNSGNAFGVGGDPEFNQKIADRWTVLRTNVLNGTNVIARIDELSAWLSEAAARDLWGKYRSGVVGVELWPNPNGAFNGTSKANHPWDVDYVKPTNYLGNATNSIIGNMKKWVLGRYLWLDGQFTPQPRFNHPGGEVTNAFTLTMTVPPGATNWYTLDGTDPRLYGGGISPSAQRYTGPITITSNVFVFARAKGPNGFYNVWSGPAKVSCYLDVPPLRITEVMYHPYPPPGGTVDDAEFFEFIEVKNIGLTPLNVNGFSLGGGVTFVFPSLALAGGQSAVVVKDVAAFQYRYGTNALIAGTYTGNLNNGGDHIVLLGRLGEVIHDFRYGDGWYPATDGTGFSLVITDENGELSSWNTKAGWRPSANLGGSPGTNDPVPPLRPAVLVNEVLTHSDTNLTPGLMDAIELYNPTGEPADVSGWYLTDDFGTPQKFMIPEDTIIPAGGYVVFWESEFNPTPGVAPSFGLSAEGDEFFLFSADPFGELTGYAHGFDFGAQVNGVTFGRHIISTGAEHFVAQQARTLGTNNAGPLVGPIVITEIMYHPTDQAIAGVGFDNSTDEYIELQNIGGEAVSLFDTNYPTNSWRLRNAVDFDFPTGVVMPPGSYLLVVPFDPNASPTATAAWRARNLVSDTLPLYGPWTGELNNGNESLELRKPDLPTTNSVPSVLVERVNYDDDTPGLKAADGLGLSLQRIVVADYGNDPTNWAAAAPNPGGPYVGGTPPTILSQPGDQILITGDDVQFAVEAAGSAPLRYQWRYNELPIIGATNSIYVITNVPLSAAGTYSVFVFNGGGSAVSTNFIVGTRVGLRILRQPISAFVTVGTATNFSVQAEGTGRIRYQWRYNGVDIPNGTNATYAIASAQTTNAGTYVVLVSDDLESVLSASVVLGLVTKPSLVLQPILTNLVVEGGTASFSVMSTGTLPIGHRWRFKGVTITATNVPNASMLFTPNSSVLTVTDARLTNAGNFSVVASNVAGTAPVSSNAWLVVLADTDHDGLPDSWENTHPGFNPTDPNDGARDEDGDGMSNSAEWYAGTDYLDPTSFLKVELTLTNTAVVQFNAVSNRTYSVQYSDGLNAGLWQKLGDVPARTTSRLEVLIDPDPGTNRFYRIVTPTQP